MNEDFETAREAAETMYEQQQDTAPRETVDAGEAAAVSTEQETNLAEKTDEAATLAEAAATVASEKDAQLASALQELSAERQKNAQLEETLAALSNQNEEQLLEEAIVPPTLDISGLAFADEEAQNAAMAKFAEDMASYNRAQILKELSPALEYAKQGLAEKERSEAISVLSQIPALSGIENTMPQLDRIISGNKWLNSADMPPEEKYIHAYTILKGLDSINTPQKPFAPTTEELMALYENNADFREQVEKKRLGELKNSQQVPTLSASSGAMNAAPNIPEKPKSFEEALLRSKKLIN